MAGGLMSIEDLELLRDLGVIEYTDRLGVTRLTHAGRVLLGQLHEPPDDSIGALLERTAIAEAMPRPDWWDAQDVYWDGPGGLCERDER